MPAFTRLLLALAIASAVVSSSSLRAEDESPRPRAGSTVTGQRGGPNLEHTMESMQKTLDALSKQVKDKTQIASSLTLVTDMERLVLTAKSIIPPRISKLDPDAQAKAKTDYQTMLLGVLRELLSAEEQLIAGKTDDAADTIAGLKQIEDQGHKEFHVKVEKD